MVIRHNFATYRNNNGPSLDQTLLIQYGLCWWSFYKSEGILNAIKKSRHRGVPRETAELVTWWDAQQFRKDLRREFALVPDRNMG